MRTLVISDLHLGARTGRDVLRRPAALAALEGALRGADRLVLLGDVVELLEGRPRAAMQEATPVLEEIGQAMRGRPIVYVPGNHDHALVRPWLQRRRQRGTAVGAASRVAIASSAGLERVAQALRPAEVEVRYPGVWLGDGVWAHHGHYLDRHLVRRGPDHLDRAEQYERALGAAAARLTAGVAESMPAVVGETVDRVGKVAAKSAVLARPVVAAVPGAGLLAPLSAGLLGYQFRRSGLPAMAEVASRLAPTATDVVFGHVHRAGPSSADGAEWRQAGLRLWNSGCWVYEPLLLARSRPPHPYWPGGALWYEDGRLRSVGLLDEIDPGQLR